MHKCGLCRHAMSVCPSVRPSVTFVDHVKTNKRIFEFFLPSGSHTILFFPYQTGWWYSDGNLPNGGLECRWGRQKTRFWTNIWLRCIQVYSTSREVWKTKPRRTAASVEHSPQRPSSVVRTRRRRSFCDGLDVIRRRRREVKPPLVIMLILKLWVTYSDISSKSIPTITPVFCCRRTSQDRTRRVFFVENWH